MKRFLGRLFLFLIPFYIIGFILLMFIGVGFYTRELYEFDDVIKEQRENHSMLIGMGYNEQTSYYKLSNANYYRANVIALGTSRVMQFKAEYFRDNFYNCGGAVAGNYDEYLNFIKNLTYCPDIIILGLDQWVFNTEWNKGCDTYPDYEEITLVDRKKVSILRDIMNDYFTRKWTFNEISKYPENVGFNGLIKDEGFQWDGSYYYGSIYRYPELQKDYMFVDTSERINSGGYRFEWGKYADKKTFEYLTELLEYCKNKGIKVIGFSPSFAPSIYEKMVVSENYDYLFEIEPTCKEIFQKYGGEYYNYSNSSVLHVDDGYFIDGFHGSDVVYAYIIKDMINNGSCISERIDSAKLDGLLENRYSRILLKGF